MVRRLFLFGGIFFALLAVPALATQVTLVTPNPETGRLDGTTMQGGTLFGTVDFAGPTFQLSDNSGRAMAGQTLFFYCTGVMACPLLAPSAKTDNFGRASLQFARPLWVFLPASGFPPGPGAPIGRYTVWATWGCPRGAQGNAAGCFTSPIVTLQAVCWGPFIQCVGSESPAPRATASAKPTPVPSPSASPASTGPGLSLVGSSPVAVPLQKICAKNAPTVCYYSFDVAAHVKLMDAGGKPVSGASINLDLGKVAGAPFPIGGSGKTDPTGLATLKANFSFDPRFAKVQFGKGSRFIGTATYGKSALAISFVVE